jgi:hypothetical protein
VIAVAEKPAGKPKRQKKGKTPRRNKGKQKQ